MATQVLDSLMLLGIASYSKLAPRDSKKDTARVLLPDAR